MCLSGFIKHKIHKRYTKNEQRESAKVFIADKHLRGDN